MLFARRALIGNNIFPGAVRRQALEIATVVVAADDDLSDIDEEALGELATALGFADRESERIIEKALESLEE